MFRDLLTVQAADLYNAIDFKKDDAIYNRPAPEPWVAFALGGLFSLISLVLYGQRVLQLQAELTEHGAKFGPGLACRVLISAFIDCNNTLFIILKTAGQSFWFLGGLQYNYKVALALMLSYFTFESCLDALRLFIAIGEVTMVKELVVVESWKGHLKKSSGTTQLTPGSVYEDLSRSPLIVTMVFITQAVLISFVVTDIFRNNTYTCPDGTKDCPIVGTFGSWCLYVLGMFMACVFLLGPKTSYGQSEQNPAFWLQLLLASKLTGRTTCTWMDPMKESTQTRHLFHNDLRIWARFILNFIINGIGFQILVHALPVQVAAQSSLTGVVIRAVGMMYLVDLDDTPGYTITLSNEAPPATKPIIDTHSPSLAVASGGASVMTVTSTSPTTAAAPAPATKTVDVAAETEKILAEAHAKLEALAAASRASNTDNGNNNNGEPEAPAFTGASQEDTFATAMFAAQAGMELEAAPMEAEGGRR